MCIKATMYSGGILVTSISVQNTYIQTLFSKMKQKRYKKVIFHVLLKV